jgi:hypothetical protein
MSEQAQITESAPAPAAPEGVSLAQLTPKVLEEVIRQLRSTRNDIIRYAVWNIRNLTDEDFNRTPDNRLFGYFKQDLLETRFLSKGRRVDVVQVWLWFDDQLNGSVPLVVDGEEITIVVQDKDLEKVRKRIEEIRSFLPALRSNDMEQFRRVKYKLRRTVMRLTYDLHHLYKRLEKHRKNVWANQDTRAPRVALETVAEIPEPPPLTGEVGEDTQA